MVTQIRENWRRTLGRPPDAISRRRSRPRSRWSALRLRGGAPLAVEPLLVAPGVGVDVDDVAVLGESVDEGAEAGGVSEDGAPLLVREVGGDHDRPGLVPLAHDAEEQVGGAGVAVRGAEKMEGLAAR